MTDAKLGEATRAYLRSGDRFWPTPGALMTAVDGASSATGEAMLAWARILQTRKEHPRWKPLTRDDDRWFLADTYDHNRLALQRLAGWMEHYRQQHDRPMTAALWYALIRRDAQWFADNGVPEDVYTIMVGRSARHTSKPSAYQQATAPTRLGDSQDEEEALWAGVWAAGGWNADVFTSEASAGLGWARQAFCKAYTEARSRCTALAVA